MENNIYELIYHNYYLEKVESLYYDNIFLNHSNLIHLLFRGSKSIQNLPDLGYLLS